VAPVSSTRAPFISTGMAPGTLTRDPRPRRSPNGTSSTAAGAAAGTGALKKDG
jgi:hypothetical protein